MEKYCHHIKGGGGGEEPSFGQFWEEEELFKVKVVMLRCWNNRSGLRVPSQRPTLTTYLRPSQAISILTLEKLSIVRPNNKNPWVSEEADQSTNPAPGTMSFLFL